jgi:hypothetical protein
MAKGHGRRKMLTSWQQEVKRERAEGEMKSRGQDTSSRA